MLAGVMRDCFFGFFPVLFIFNIFLLQFHVSWCMIN